MLLVAAPARGPRRSTEEGGGAAGLREIIPLDRSLSVADEKFNLANLRLQHVKEELKLNHRELIVARRNLGRGRTMIQKRLVSLYTSTTPSTLDLILGSTSISDLLTRIDNATASRASTAR